MDTHNVILLSALILFLMDLAGSASTYMAKLKNKLRIGKPKGEFEKIYQLIDGAKTEDERRRWKAVLKRLEDNPPPKPSGAKSSSPKIPESQKS